MNIRTQRTLMNIQTQTTLMNIKTQRTLMNIQTQTTLMNIQTQTTLMNIQTQTTLINTHNLCKLDEYPNADNHNGYLKLGLLRVNHIQQQSAAITVGLSLTHVAVAVVCNLTNQNDLFRVRSLIGLSN